MFEPCLEQRHSQTSTPQTNEGWLGDHPNLLLVWDVEVWFKGNNNTKLTCVW